MSIQQGISSEVYKMADAAQNPQQIKDLQGILTRSIQNGALPSYIGVPILSNLNQRLQQVSNQGAPQQPQEPPIAEQVMQQAQQPAPQQAQGLNSLPSNLPTQGMYGGGIVALAEGGEIDYEDEEDQRDEAEYLQALQQAQENTAQLLDMPTSGIASALPKKEEINRTPNVEQGIKEGHGIVGLKGKDFYNSMYNTLLTQAKDMGVKNPEAIARLGAAQSSLETGYGKSTAGGNNYFGIKGQGISQPTREYNAQTNKMENATDSFRKYGSMGDSASDYINFLQTNPRYAGVLKAESPEQAIALQGKTGYATDPEYAQKLASIHRSNAGITALAEGGAIPKYNGTNTAGSLVNTNSDDPLLGGTMNPEDLYTLQHDNPTAFNRLMRNTFEGGNPPIQGIGRTSTVMTTPVRTQPFTKSETPYTPGPDGGIGGASLLYRRQHGASNAAPVLNKIEQPSIAYRNLTSSDLNAPYTETPQVNNGIGYSADDANSLASKYPLPAFSQEDINAGYGDAQDNNLRGKYPVVNSASSENQALVNKETTQQAVAKTPYDEFMERMNKREEGLAQQKDEDKYMALLTAGLGMMGGTSPFAAANIGQGALAGVANYAQAAKQRGAEQTAIDKNIMLSSRYKDLNDLTRQNQDFMLKKFNISEADKVANQKAIAEDRQTALNDKRSARDAVDFAKNTQLLNQMESNWVLKHPFVTAAMTPEDKAMAMDKAKAQLYETPQYKSLFKKLYPDAEMPEYGAGKNVIRYDASGKRIE